MQLRFYLMALLLCGTACGQSVYVKDVDFALEELRKNCGGFFKLKGIDWKKVTKTFRAESRKVRDGQEHLVLLVRLLARLRDGHARVKPGELGKNITWPEDKRGRRGGPGMFFCRIGKRIYVKNSWSNAAGAGIKPGMEVLTVDGVKTATWLDAKVTELSDRISFSTDDQAFFSACHGGLSGTQGDRMKLEIKTLKGKRKKKTLTYGRASTRAQGPAFFPKGLKATPKGNMRYGKTEGGYGYIHLRKCRQELPSLMDEALAAIGRVPGLILDFRANGGGGFDHDAFMGRFVPRGKTINLGGKRYGSAGPTPYGGPVVIIVDATVMSAGETASAIFKEDGRGYMIGESPTAGMSSQKTTIELPSRLFSLYVSIRSNMRRSNKGKGLEGIGAVPHEIVQYKPKDLAAGIDTLIARAEKLLKKLPKNKVPYDPKRFGWK